MDRMIAHLREQRGKLDVATQAPKKKPPPQKLEGDAASLLAQLGLDL